MTYDIWSANELLLSDLDNNCILGWSRKVFKILSNFAAKAVEALRFLKSALAFGLQMTFG